MAPFRTLVPPPTKPTLKRNNFGMKKEKENRAP